MPDTTEEYAVWIQAAIEKQQPTELTPLERVRRFEIERLRQHIEGEGIRRHLTQRGVR